MSWLSSNNKEQLTEVVYNYVVDQKLKISKTTLAERLRQHPDNRSLRSLMDVFDSFNIYNKAIKLDVQKDISFIHEELNAPFFAYLNEDNGAFIYVTEFDHQRICYFSLFKGKVQEDWGSFKQKWSGILLAVDASEYVPEKKYFLKRFFEASEVIGIFGFTLFFILGSLWLWNQHNLQLVPLLLLKFIGICISIVLLVYESDENSLAAQVCAQVKANCGSVLASEGAKLFGIFSWTELGLIYFIGGTLLLLGGNATTSGNLFLLATINLPTLFFSFYSISYQKWIVREWCFFCLLTLGLFWTEGLNYYFLDAYQYDNFQSSSLIWFAISFIIPFLLLIVFKPLLSIYNQFKITQTHLDKVKANRNIFYNLLANNNIKSLPEFAKPLVFGSLGAKNTITLVTNPGCSHCADLHNEVERIQELNTDIKVNVIFAINESNDFENFQVANTLMTMYHQKGAELTWKALRQWYDSDNQSFEKWFSIQGIPKGMETQTSELGLHKDWCINNDITHTPVVLLNGHKLPGMYELRDIPAFLN